MAKITKEAIDIAHKLILANDLEGICKWLDLYKVKVDRKLFRKTIETAFAFGDPARALKLFDSCYQIYF